MCEMSNSFCVANIMDYLLSLGSPPPLLLIKNPTPPDTHCESYIYLLHKHTLIGHVALSVQATCKKETLAASTGHVWGFPAPGRQQQKVIHHQLPRRQPSHTLQSASRTGWASTAAVSNALGNRGIRTTLVCRAGVNQKGGERGGRVLDIGRRL